MEYINILVHTLTDLITPTFVNLSLRDKSIQVRPFLYWNEGCLLFSTH